MCPPLAVLLMGRPFSACWNLILTGLFLWVPGVKHALVCYADHKIDKKVDKVVDAINHPSHASSGGGGVTNITHNHYAAPANATLDPRVGANGTVFRTKS